jgi:hypothetical protein
LRKRKVFGEKNESMTYTMRKEKKKLERLDVKKLGQYEEA